MISRISSAPVRKFVDVTSFASVRDPILRNALLGSVSVHLLLLILSPAPALPGPPQMNPVQFMLAAVEPEAEPSVDEPEPTVVSEEMPESEAEPETAAAAESASEPVTDPEPTPEVVPEAEILPEVSFEEDAALVLPEIGSAAAADPVEPREEERHYDADAVSKLLDETAEIEATHSELKRYRFAIREQLLRTLQQQHEAMGQAAPRPKFRLRFRIDEDGYLYDLSMRVPKGAAVIPDSIRFAIESLSPFAKTPTGKVVEIDFLIDFQ